MYPREEAAIRKGIAAGEFEEQQRLSAESIAKESSKLAPPTISPQFDLKNELDKLIDQDTSIARSTIFSEYQGPSRVNYLHCPNA